MKQTDRENCPWLSLVRGEIDSLGSFSNDYRYGSKNVIIKNNSRFFKLCRVYSNSLKIKNVGEFPEV